MRRVPGGFPPSARTVAAENPSRSPTCTLLHSVCVIECGEERQAMERVQWGAIRMDERGILDRAQAGNSAAFTELFDQYQRPIVNYLYRMVNDREVAEDLAQDTFLKAYRAIDRTDPDLNFRAWIYRIATNTAMSYFRRKRLVQWIPFGPSTPDRGKDLRLAERVGESQLIEQAMAKIG